MLKFVKSKKSHKIGETVEIEPESEEDPAPMDTDEDKDKPSPSTLALNIEPSPTRKRKRTEKHSKKPSAEAKKSKIFIAVHLGAGNHSLRKKDAYKALCKSACEEALKLLENGKSADDAAVAATMILESSGLVNTGKGSNLTLEKTVECDAGFMNGDGCFGGVGAVSGIPNPILLAKKIAEFQNGANKLSCGRVPPNFLVGAGAKTWGESQGVPTCRDETLISRKAARTYTEFLSRLEKHKNDIITGDENVNDTVGAVALDKFGKVAATVSSGGNWLKFPGRIGHSPLFGSGCWASNLSKEENSAVAVSTTGVGEMLAKIHWASECSSALRDEGFCTPVEAISSTIKTKFLDSQLLKHHMELKIIGVIALLWDGIAGEFIWGHTSQSLIVGYGGTGFSSIKMDFSALQPNSKVGETVKVAGIRL